MESKNVVVGGGTVEAALSIFLEIFATTIASRCQSFTGWSEPSL
jgi:T-complex protein 1 subunit alpha